MISHLVSNGPSVCMWSQDCFCASVLFHLCLCWISSVSFYWTVVLLQLLKVSPCPSLLLSLSTITTSFSFTTHFLRYWHIQWKAPDPSTFPSRTSWVTPLHCKYFSLLSSVSCLFISYHSSTFSLLSWVLCFFKSFWSGTSFETFGNPSSRINSHSFFECLFSSSRNPNGLQSRTSTYRMSTSANYSTSIQKYTIYRPAQTFVKHHWGMKIV